MIHYPATPINLNDLPYPSNCDVQLFVGAIGSGGSDNNWKIWNKPKGSTISNILTIGGGGGGGGGFSSAGNLDKGGGGGGASGGISSLFIPSFFLPDVLYILAGDGGQGGATATIGTAGGISYVSLSPSITAPNVVIQSNTLAAGGGGAGTATTAAGGTGGTIATITAFGTLGKFSAIAGQTGASAPSGIGNTAGTATTAWASIPISAGASGGSTTGTNVAGGPITPQAATSFTYLNWPNAAGAVAAAGGAAAGNGSAGVNIWKPFRSSGAAGGGTSTTAGGGVGGGAGIGSGGGGGGAGVTGGRGGNGGPGMVLIISW
jgi:hypothetical protein